MKSGIFLVIFLFKLVMATTVYAQIVDIVYSQKDRLLYKGYELTRSYDSRKRVWFATLKKGDQTLATFKKGGHEKRWTRFALFPFLAAKTKQLIIEQFSGGAHCCSYYWIFDLSPDFHLIYDSGEYDVGYILRPLDLDGDRVFEFAQHILTFDYFDRLPHVYSPLPVVVFKYDKGARKYFPANHMFSTYGLTGIEQDIRKVKEFNEKTDFTGYDDSEGKYLFMMLEVIFPYVYAGKEKEAWSFYDEEYRLKDKEEMKFKIRKRLESCPVYKYIYSR